MFTFIHDTYTFEGDVIFYLIICINCWMENKFSSTKNLVLLKNLLFIVLARWFENLYLNLPTHIHQIVYHKLMQVLLTQNVSL